MPPPADYHNPHMPVPMGVGKRQKGRHYNAGLPPPPPAMGSFISANETAEEARELLVYVQPC